MADVVARYSLAIVAQLRSVDAPTLVASVRISCGRTCDMLLATLPLMPGKHRFEERIASLDRLRQQAPESATAPLRKALSNRNNFLVAKAADLARDFRLTQLVPELLRAFDRFFQDAIKSDPQCWAKNSISRALASLEHQNADVFLRGMRHIQLEPVWGGRSDTAATLRGTCALALVQCRSVREPEMLAQLIELFADKEKIVRIEAARALGQVGSPAAALLLRLKATVSGDEPEVLGACYGGILNIEGASAISWVARFLSTSDDAGAEAALALAGTHSLQAFEILREKLGTQRDPWFRSVLLSAIALTRQQPALDFLFELIRTESLHAPGAVEAILRSSPSAEIVGRVKKLVENNANLRQTFRANWESSR